MPLQIIRQDITQMHVDAIVNTTNEEMVGYNGVDLAVHEGAGPLLDLECRRIAPLGLGCAKLTPGYNLPAKYIIHTSGPVWQGGLAGESILLKSCYLESLQLAVANGCESVAFPLISSGTYGYPKDQVLQFAIQVITAFLVDHELTVYLCVFDRTSYEISQKLMDAIRDVIRDDTESANEALPAFDASENKHFMMRLCTVRDGAAAEKPRPSGKKPSPPKPTGSAVGITLEEYLKGMDKPFALRLFDLIDEKKMTDVECYKKANVDRKTFSKIKSNPQTYKPSKQTAVAFAIALRLNLEETQELLATAGLTLSRSVTFDKIIRYFIQNEVYDIYVINQALFEFDQVCLGC